MKVYMIGAIVSGGGFPQEPTPTASLSFSDGDQTKAEIVASFCKHHKEKWPGIWISHRFYIQELTAPDLYNMAIVASRPAKEKGITHAPINRN